MKLALLSIFLAIPLAAQTVTGFPDQVIVAGASFNQQSAPQLSGFFAYAKLASASGIYSYTRISETSVQLKPSIAVQTQTETGLCIYTHTFGAFKLFSCATGGLSAAGGSAGGSATGTLLATKDIGKGWSIGLAAGPSWSGVTGVVSYPVGLIIGWGR